MMNLRTIVESTLVPHTAFEEATQRLEQCFSYADGASEPICIAVVGESRTGKSRALEECLSRHPRVRNQDGLRYALVLRTPEIARVLVSHCGAHPQNGVLALLAAAWVGGHPPADE